MRHRYRFTLFRVIYFVCQMPIGLILPFLIIHFRYEVGLTPREIAQVLGMGGLVMIAVQQAWGYVADTLVPKRVLIIWNSLVAGGLFMWMGSATTFHSILLIYFIYSVVSTPLLQLIHGLLLSHDGGERRFGTIRAYGSLGFIVANLLTAIAADRLFEGKVWFIFPAYVVVSVAAAILVAIVPEVISRAPARPSFMSVQRFLLSRPAVRVALVFVFVYQAAHGLSYSLQSVLMINLGADNRIVAVSYSLAALLELPVFFMADRLVARYGELRLMTIAAVVQVVRWLLVWHADSPEAIILISMMHAITFGLFFGAAVCFMNRYAGPHFKASAQTMFALVYFGAATVASNYLGAEFTPGGYLHPHWESLLGWAGLPTGPDALSSLYLLAAGTAAASVVLGLAAIAAERRDEKAQVVLAEAA